MIRKVIIELPVAVYEILTHQSALSYELDQLKSRSRK